MNAYKVSKKLAERSAWEFLEKEKPNFTIATVRAFPNLFFYLFTLLASSHVKLNGQMTDPFFCPVIAKDHPTMDFRTLASSRSHTFCREFLEPILHRESRHG